MVSYRIKGVRGWWATSCPWSPPKLAPPRIPLAPAGPVPRPGVNQVLDLQLQQSTCGGDALLPLRATGGFPGIFFTARGPRHHSTASGAAMLVNTMPRPRLTLVLLAWCAVGCVVPALAATSPSKGAGLLVTTAGCGPPANKFSRNNGGDDAAAAAAAAGAATAGDAVLLRVAPWAGCGAQVTFGLGWSTVLPLTLTLESESVHTDTHNKSVMPDGTPVGDVAGDVSVGVVSYPGRASRARAPRPAGAAAHAPQKHAGARRTPRYPFRTPVSLPSHLYCSFTAVCLLQLALQLSCRSRRAFEPTPALHVLACTLRAGHDGRRAGPQRRRAARRAPATRRFGSHRRAPGQRAGVGLDPEPGPAPRAGERRAEAVARRPQAHRHAPQQSAGRPLTGRASRPHFSGSSTWHFKPFAPGYQT